MALENLIGIKDAFDSQGFEYPKEAETIFPPTEMEQSISMVAQPNPVQSQEKKTILSRDDFFSDVKEAVKRGKTPEEAMKGLTEYYVSKGVTVQGYEDQFTPEAIEAKKEENTGFRDTLTGGIKDIGNFFKVESEEDDNFLESAGKFLVNVPGDTVEMVGEIWDAILHPIDTGKGMFDLAKGLSDKLVYTVGNKLLGTDVPQTEQAEMVSAIGTHLKENYGTVEKVRMAMVNNPTDVLTTLFGGSGAVKKFAQAKNMTNLVKVANKAEQILNPINILKKEGQLAQAVTSKITGGISESIIQTLGKTTGAGAEAIRTAIQKGGTSDFAKALSGKIDDQEILNKAIDAFDTIRENRSKVYGEDYKKLQANKTALGMDDLQQSFIDNLDDSRVVVDVSDDGIKLNFDNSTITQKASQKQISEMFDDIINWTDDTPEGLDVLKQRVQDRFLGGEGTKKADRFSTIVSNQIKDKVVAQVPEYAEMTRKYGEITDMMNDINKVLKVGDDKAKMTAMTRLQQTMKDNLSMRKDMLDTLEELSGMDISASISGSALKSLVPKGMQGVILPSVVGGGAVAGGVGLSIIPLLLTASPRVVGQFARAVGVSKNVLNKALSNLKKIKGKLQGIKSLDGAEDSLDVKGFKQKNLIDDPKGSLIEGAEGRAIGGGVAPEDFISVWDKKYSFNRDKLDSIISKYKKDGIMPLREELETVFIEKPKILDRSIAMDSIKRIIDTNYNKKPINNVKKSPIDLYTRHQGRINSYLRNKKWTHLDETKELTKNLLSDLKLLPEYKWKTYRWIKSFDEIGNLKVWDIYTDNGLVSSSKSKIVADRFAKDFLFEIEWRTGKDLKDLWSMISEQEVLFMPNTKFIVKSITNKSWKKIISIKEN